MVTTPPILSHIPPFPTAQLFSNYLKDDKAPFIGSDVNSLSYTNWTTHLSGISDTVLVPPEAAAITTLLDLTQWQNGLSEHPNTALVHFLSLGYLKASDLASTTLHPCSNQPAKI